MNFWEFRNLLPGLLGLSCARSFMDWLCGKSILYGQLQAYVFYLDFSQPSPARSC